jgi:TolB-like protein/Tfp pilus assembly protein PilF
MLAILPFANIEGDPEQEYFCDGMTDEIILQLSRLSPDKLGVIARTSSMHYKGSAKRLDEIARELGVRYVLEGTVRRRGQRVRIAARLVRSDDQTPLWAEGYERDVADVFDIQMEVARRIADSLALELIPGSTQLAAQVPRASTEVYEAYLKGRYYWNRRAPSDLERAVALLEEAVTKDRSYVPAATALADALNVLPWYGLRPPREAYPRSKEIARQALAVDDTSAAAHTALAYAHHYYDWNWQDAEREYGRALELNPNYAQAHQWLAAHYAELGRTDEALAEMQRAQQLDPRSIIIHAAIGWIDYLGRRFDDASVQLQQTLQLDPDFVPARLWLGQTLEALGKPQDAIDQYLRVRHIARPAPSGLGELARGYAAAGREQEARATLTELLAVAQARYVEPDLIARVYEALGQRDEAITVLERGFSERAVKLVLIGVDPQFDRLRGDPRFQTLLQRLNLPNRGNAR